MCDHSNESYWADYFHVLLFIVLYKVVQAFTSDNKTLMKAIEQYSHMVLFIMLCKVVQALTLIKWMTTQMKATEQYFHVVLFTMLYKVV